MQLSEFVKNRIEEAVGNIVLNPIKDGYRTTEFGTAASLISFLCSQAYLTSDPQWGYAAAVVALGYLAVRAYVKGR